ncbi:NAD(P)-binding protein [Stipitochalara longipes BDJ]|nr:NAD(P)-binding protein [Stipitochalara longipes BDJ]
MAAKKILVVGATGQQGSAVIKALLANKSNFDIYGLTRNKASPSALRLAKQNVTIIEGDVTKPSLVFEKIGKVWGVFSVTTVGADEEEQAKPLIDAAIANGAQFFVYSSVHRGINSETDPTYVPHFITKYNVEKHLVEKAAQSPQKMGWTILRPTGFMDNLTPDFGGKSFARMVQQMGTTRLKMVCTTDIGKAAAYALDNPEKCNGKAVELSSESLTFQEMNKIFREEVGYDLPLAPGMLVRTFFFFNSDLGKMAKWFREGGWNSAVEPNNVFPNLMDFRTWLRTTSKWETKK